MMGGKRNKYIENVLKTRGLLVGDASKRGFTLTELAIVLGIIGLILGGIWTAASKVYSNYKVNAARQELITIVTNVTNLMHGQPFPNPNPPAPPPAANITSLMIELGVVPSQYVINSNNAAHPWTTSNVSELYIFSAPTGTGTGGSVPNPAELSFEVSFYGPSRDGCINLFAATTQCQPGQFGCPLAVSTAGSGGFEIPDPVKGWGFLTMATIEADCKLNDTASNGGAVEFLYSL